MSNVVSSENSGVLAATPPMAPKPRVSNLPTNFSSSPRKSEDEDNPESAMPSAIGLAALSAALLAACGGGGGGGDSTGSATPSAPGTSGTAPAPGAVPTPPVATSPASPPAPAPVVEVPVAAGFNNFPKAANDAQAARFLQQLQFSSTPAEIKAVSDSNFAGYLQQQMQATYDINNTEQSGWAWLESRGYGLDANLEKNVYNTTIADYMLWKQLMTAPDAMRKRIALALSEYFVISGNLLEIDWRGYIVAGFWEILNKHAFGNFRALLEDVTLSPGMGYFLNTRGNKKADTKGRLPDENYAREIMQLFTIGLYALNTDGTIKTNGGAKVESYSSADVTELAKVFTGYEFDRGSNPYAPGSSAGITFPGRTYKVWPREYARKPMNQTNVNESEHSPEEIKFLGSTIAANTLSAVALGKALDTLFNHPNVGPFFGRQMIQRLVKSDPSPAYVARVANAFANNGAGVRGDMKAVWTAILLDDEARDPAGVTDPFSGKLREPMIRLVQWARSFNVTSKSGTWKIADLSDTQYALGQSPMRAPSVFNYFRPGYVPPGTEMASLQATSPEFQIANETTVSTYINYMQNAIRSGLYTFDPGTNDVTYNVGGTTDIKPDYSSYYALIDNSVINNEEATRVATALINRLDIVLTAGQLSVISKTDITGAIKAGMLQGSKLVTNADTPAMAEKRHDLITVAILMVMCSSDYLIQK